MAEFARAHGKGSNGTVGALSSDATKDQGNNGRRAVTGLPGLTSLSAAIFLSLGLSTTSSAAVGDAVCVREGQDNSLTNEALGSGIYNSGTYEVACGANAVASGQHAIAVGNEAAAEGLESIAIGRAANAQNNNSTALGSRSQSTGLESTALGTRSTASGSNAIAIGDGSQATGANGVAIGSDGTGSNADRATTAGNNATAVGSYAQATGSSQSTAVGYNSRAIGENSSAVGASAQATADLATAIGRGARALADSASAFGVSSVAYSDESVALGRSAIAGDQNDPTGSINATALGSRAQATGFQSIAVGQNSQATNSSANAIGTNSRAYSSESIALGQAAIAGDQSNPSGTPNATALGSQAEATANLATAVGFNAESSAIHSTSVGSAARATAEYSTALGRHAQATGVSGVAVGTVSRESTDSTAVPIYVQASGARSTALGPSARSTADEAIAIGNLSQASGEQSLAIGDEATVSGANSGALGTNNNVDQANTFVLGNDVTTTQANSVVLGNASTDRAATAVNQATVNSVTYSGFAGVGSPTNGVVSVGSEGSERQIINVAAGEVSATSTDAINGSQLFSVAEQVSQGFNISADNGADDNVQLGETVNFTNTDGNLVSTVNGNEIVYDLADDITVQQATIGDPTGENTVLTSTADGLDVGGDRITNVADGVNGDDAATVSQVRSAAAAASTEVAAGTNVADVAETTGTAGQTIYTVNAEGAIVEAGDGVSVSSTTDDATNDTTYTVGLNQETQDSLASADSAIQSVTSVDDNLTATTDENNNVTLDLSDTPTFEEVTSNRVVVGDPAGENTVLTSTADGLDVGGDQITNVGAGEISETSTDAVNGSQLNDTNTRVADNAQGISDNADNITAAQNQINEGFNISADNGADDNVQLGETVNFTNTDGNLVSTVNGNEIVYDLADSITVGDSTEGNPVTVNGTTGTVTGLTNTDYDPNEVVADRTATEGQVAGVANQLGSLSETPLIFAGDSGDNVKRELGDTLNVQGGADTADLSEGNIGVVADGTDSLNIRLAKRLTGLKSAQFTDGAGNTSTISPAGTNVVDDQGNESNYGAAGSTITDDAGNTTTTAADGVTVSDDSGNSTNYGAEGLTFIDPETGETLAGTPSVTKEGIDAGDKKLTGVAAGDVVAGSTDAVNGDQLFQTNQAVAKNTADIAKSIGVVSKGFNISADNGDDDNVQLSETVNFTNDDGNLVATVSDNTITYDLADDIHVSSVSADDGEGNKATLSASGTDVTDAEGNHSQYGAAGSTMTDDAGNKTVTSAQGVSVSDGTSTTVYGAEGLSFVDKNGEIIANTPTVSVNGIDAGNQVITNVAEGRIEEGSTDAVNGGQLYQTNQAITQVASSVDDLGYRLDDVQQESNAGVSSAMAMASMPQAYLPGKSMIAGGIATYNGEGAVAVGVSKLSDNGRWVFKINGSADTEGNAGAAAGVGMHW